MDSNFRAIICFHIGWQGSVMIPTTQISPFHLLLRIVWMKTNTEQYLFLGVFYFSRQIFSWVVNDNIVSASKCVSLFQFWLTLCQAHSVPIQWKSSYQSFFCGQNFWPVATTVHLYYLPLLYITSPWNVFQTKIPWLINMFLLNQMGQFWLKWQFFGPQNHTLLNWYHNLNQGP